jgi:hypothetical protein
MFDAVLTHPYAPFTNSALTKGKTYRVIDASDWSGTYTILDDNGERKCVDWQRFEDQGKALSAWQRRA